MKYDFKGRELSWIAHRVDPDPSQGSPHTSLHISDSAAPGWLGARGQGSVAALGVFRADLNGQL